MPVHFPTTALALFWVTTGTGKGGVEFVDCTQKEEDVSSARRLVEQAKQWDLYPNEPALKTLLKDAVLSTPGDFLLRIQKSPFGVVTSGPTSLSGRSFEAAVYLGFLVERITAFVKPQSPDFENWNPMIVVSARVDGIKLASTDDIDLKWKAACRLAHTCGSAENTIRFCFAGNDEWRPGKSQAHPLDAQEQAASQFLIPRKVADLPGLVRELFDDYDRFIPKRPPPSTIPPEAAEPGPAPAKRRKAWWLAGGGAVALAAIALVLTRAPMSEPAKIAATPAADTLSGPAPTASSVAPTTVVPAAAAEPSVAAPIASAKRSKQPTGGPKPRIDKGSDLPPVDDTPDPTPVSKPAMEEPPKPPPIDPAPLAKPRSRLFQEGE
jgi:hypothetical protein